MGCPTERNTHGSQIPFRRDHHVGARLPRCRCGKTSLVYRSVFKGGNDHRALPHRTAPRFANGETIGIPRSEASSGSSPPRRHHSGRGHDRRRGEGPWLAHWPLPSGTRQSDRSRLTMQKIPPLDELKDSSRPHPRAGTPSRRAKTRLRFLRPFSRPLGVRGMLPFANIHIVPRYPAIPHDTLPRARADTARIAWGSNRAEPSWGKGSR